MTTMKLKNISFYKTNDYGDICFIASIRRDSENYFNLKELGEKLAENYPEIKAPLYHNISLDYRVITFKKSNSFKKLMEKEPYNITFQIQKKKSGDRELFNFHLTECKKGQTFEPNELIDFKALYVKKPE